MGVTGDPEPRPVTIEVQQYKFAVRPHPLRVSPKYGESAQFFVENSTPFDLDIDFLRDDLVKNGQGQYVRTVAVRHGTNSDTLTINLNLGNARYAYQILVQLGVALQPGFEATGGSRPEIEIRK